MLVSVQVTQGDKFLSTTALYSRRQFVLKDNISDSWGIYDPFLSSELACFKGRHIFCLWLPVGFVVTSDLWDDSNMVGTLQAGAVPAPGAAWLQGSGRAARGPGGAGCWLPPRSYRITATTPLQSLWPMTLLSSRPKEVVQWDSVRLSALTGWFLDLPLFCAPFPPPPSLSPVLHFVR